MKLNKIDGAVGGSSSSSQPGIYIAHNATRLENKLLFSGRDGQQSANLMS